MVTPELDVIEYGKVTSPAAAGTNVLNDNTKNWAVNIHQNRLVKVFKGAGSGQLFPLQGNGPQALVIRGTWTLPLDTTSEYVILSLDLAQVLKDVFGGGLEVDLGKIIPIAKAAIPLNTALPAAGTDWLVAAITPTNSPSFLRIYVAVAVAGILRIARTVGGVTVVENLNHGVNLTANDGYIFDIEWRTGDSINLRYSATGANILIFRADEIGGAL